MKKRGELDAIVERSLRGAALWDEVKDRLKASGLGLSGGQQQRLCIARAIAVEPEVILMDEPCSALDPIATARIEELMQEIKTKYTIVIVTHNMQQAARVSDRTAFFTTEINPESDRRTGRLVEYNPTGKIFSNPDDERTEQYVTGRFGDERASPTAHAERSSQEPPKPATCGRASTTSSTRSARRSPSSRPASPRAFRGPRRSCSPRTSRAPST